MDRERREHVVLRRSGSATAGARQRGRASDPRRSALAGSNGLARGRRASDSSGSSLDSDIGPARGRPSELDPRAARGAAGESNLLGLGSGALDHLRQLAGKSKTGVDALRELDQKEHRAHRDERDHLGRSIGREEASGLRPGESSLSRARSAYGPKGERRAGAGAGLDYDDDFEDDVEDEEEVRRRKLEERKREREKKRPARNSNEAFILAKWDELPENVRVVVPPPRNFFSNPKANNFLVKHFHLHEKVSCTFFLISKIRFFKSIFQF